MKKENPQEGHETLSDKERKGVDITSDSGVRTYPCEPYLYSKDVKDAVKNAERRLKEDVIADDDGEEISPEWQRQKIVKIFKEEFGDKLK